MVVRSDGIIIRPRQEALEAALKGGKGPRPARSRSRGALPWVAAALAVVVVGFAHGQVKNKPVVWIGKWIEVVKDPVSNADQERVKDAVSFSFGGDCTSPREHGVKWEPISSASTSIQLTRAGGNGTLLVTFDRLVYRNGSVGVDGDIWECSTGDGIKLRLKRSAAI